MLFQEWAEHRRSLLEIEPVVSVAPTLTSSILQDPASALIREYYKLTR